MENTEVAKVQEKFIEEIHGRGIGTVLDWIDGWYTRYADAYICDLLSDVPKEEQYECALQYALSLAIGQGSKSTGQGTNMLRSAFATEWARLVIKRKHMSKKNGGAA